MSLLIDSHCHLDDERLAGEEEIVLRNAREAGVEACVSIGTDENTSAAAAGLAGRHPGVVFHTVGAHPNDADRFGEKELNEIERLARETKPVAIGEVGLDYFHASDRQKQARLFERMIRLARELSLPLVVHDREAHEDLYQILKSEAQGLRLNLHCYSAGLDFLEKFLGLGCLVSFAGPLTFKNGQNHRDVAAKVPLERILVETDAPYLAPHPNRGKRNEPAFVKLVAEKLAEVKNTPLPKIAEITTQNARNFFRI
jgi:TatD DNase family protein